MNLIAVEGGRRLGGELTVQSAKNGVLPVLAAAILCREPCLIRRCPRLSDVDTAVRILRHLGAQARWEGEDLLIDARELTRCDVPEELMRRMRSSVMGPSSMSRSFCFSSMRKSVPYRGTRR